MTNGDRIRKMTDRDLSEIFNKIKECVRGECSKCPLNEVKVICTERSILEWLKKDIKENENTSN